MRFKVGDRVVSNTGWGTKNLQGKVVEFCSNGGDQECLVEFLGWGKGHNGNGAAKGKYSGDNCWWIWESDLRPIEERIEITTDGKVTTATLYDNDGIKKIAEARCNPADKFDFMIGAKLALDKLAKPEFKPHLIHSRTNTNYGEIGKPTKYKDLFCRQLYIGDTVDIYSSNGEKCGEYPICHNETEKDFVMGIAADCDSEKGTIYSYWKIIKNRDYKNIPNGEIIKSVKYIKEAR